MKIIARAASLPMEDPEGMIEMGIVEELLNRSGFIFLDEGDAFFAGGITHGI